MDEETKELLKKNNQMLGEILRISQKTKTYIITQQIFGVIKILIIVVPIILGIIYLPSILGDILKPYQELLGTTEQLGNLNGGNINADSVNKILEKYTK